MLKVVLLTKEKLNLEKHSINFNKVEERAHALSSLSDLIKETIMFKLNESSDKTPGLSLYQSLSRVHGTIEELKAEASELTNKLHPHISHIFVTDIIAINGVESKLVELTSDNLQNVKRLKEVLVLIRSTEINCGEEAGYKLTNDNFDELTIKECKRLAMVAILDIILTQHVGSAELYRSNLELVKSAIVK